MDTQQRVRLPQQHSGHHDQLEELAAILSAQADARRASLTIVRADPDDRAPTILPARRSHRGRHIIGSVVLALCAGAVAMLTRSVWQTTSSAPAQPAPPAVTAPSTPTDPSNAATWGQAARARLAAGGRPVSVFGCMAAYDVDAPRSSGMLPIAGQGTSEYDEYLHACVSDMSGHAVTPNEVAR